MILIRGDVVTMGPTNDVVTGGAVAVRGTTIVAVGTWKTLRAQHPSALVIGDDSAIHRDR